MAGRSSRAGTLLLRRLAGGCGGIESDGERGVEERTPQSGQSRLRAGDTPRRGRRPSHPDLFRVGVFPRAASPRPDHPASPLPATTGPTRRRRVAQPAPRRRAGPARGDRAHAAGPPPDRVRGRLTAPLRRRRPGRGDRHRARPPPASTTCSGRRCACAKARGDGERYFGCGERTAGLEKTGSHQVFWNIDPPDGHSASSSSNLYTSIPFTLSLQGGVARGLFVDHPGRVELDLAKQDPERVRGDRRRLARLLRLRRPHAARGPGALHGADGPHRAAAAVGARQPAVALGLQTADEIRGDRARDPRRGIPCDVIHLDIDYMDGYRVFTWDPKRFPDPARLFAELARRRLPRRHDRRPRREGRPGLRASTPTVARAASSADLDGRGVPQRRLARRGAFPDFNPSHARMVGRAARRAPRRGRCRHLVRHERARAVRPAARHLEPDVVHPGGGEARLHGRSTTCTAPRWRRPPARGCARPARTRPFVITRAGYAGAAAARDAVDGRQLVLVGAPVDEHAPAAEPRPVGHRVLRRRRRRLLRRLPRASCWRAGPSSAPSSRSAATTPARAPRAGAVGVRGAVGDASAATCCVCGCGCCRTCTRSSTRRPAPARRSCARCCSSTPRT